MFERAHHNRILTLLQALDGGFFLETACYFGGGTAIVLQLGEYRQSDDIDFLCASQHGYRLVRAAAFGGRFDRFLRTAMPLLRDLRADQYGIRTVIGVEGAAVRFEIVREALVELSGAMDPVLGVPVLCRDDLYCQKLLANADRWQDRSTLSRDVIDLAMMVRGWGPVPEAAWTKARSAYGDAVDRSFQGASAMIADGAWLQTCLDRMGMEQGLLGEIRRAIGG